MGLLRGVFVGVVGKEVDGYRLSIIARKVEHETRYRHNDMKTGAGSINESIHSGLWANIMAVQPRFCRGGV